MKKQIDLLPEARLLFHVNHPTLEDCWAFGYQAAAAEVDENENPFDADSLEHEHWTQGWWAGFYGEAPIHVLNPSAPVKLASATLTAVSTKPLSANDQGTEVTWKQWGGRALKLAGALAATSFVGYQLLDMVA